MIANDFFIQPASWQSDQEHLRAVREQVFIVEQKVREEEEWDELDATSYHVLAFDREGTPIGCGRLTPEHKIGRMAVIQAWRGRGVGEAILRTLVEQATARRWESVELNAQVSALGFYEKLGFSAFGDEFVEVDIAHRMMRRALSAPATPDRPGVPDRPTPKLVIIESREQALTLALELIGLARRELAIYTRDLDADLLNNEDALEALRHVATAGRGASIRIIVQDTQPATKNGHRLVGLAQRLSSVFAIRIPVQDTDLQFPSAFLINDRGGFYFRVLGSRFDGEGNAYAPGRHRQLREYFNQVWERSEPAAELRQLDL